MYPEFIEVAKEEGEKAAVGAFTMAMKAEEVFYYLCPVCGNIEKSIPEKCAICGVPGGKFIKY